MGSIANRIGIRISPVRQAHEREGHERVECWFQDRMLPSECYDKMLERQVDASGRAGRSNDETDLPGSASI